MLAMLLSSLSQGQWVNCPSTTYCEFELILSGRQPSSWPGVANTTFLGEFCVAAGVAGCSSLVANMTKVFDTVVLGVWSASGTPNASDVAWNLVSAVNSQSGQMATVCTTYSISSAIYGYRPVMVPSYLRVSDEPDQTIFAVLGAVAAVLVVVQFAYGLYHFKGFGFIVSSKDERD